MKYLIINASLIFFFIVLTLSFVIEGIGVKGGREFVYLLLLISPFILFLIDTIQKKKYYFTNKEVLVFLGFIFVSVISVILSLNKQNSFELLLLNLSYAFLFIYVYNHKKNIKRFIIPFIIVVGFFYCFYSIILSYFIHHSYLKPVHGYQFVYSLFGEHNNVGDLLILPIIISVYGLFIYKKKKNEIYDALKKLGFRYHKLIIWLLLFFFTLNLIFSFSRSAYLSILIFLSFCFFYYGRENIVTSSNKFFLFIVILFLGVLFYSTTNSFSNVLPLKSVQEHLFNDYNLDQKKFLGNRVSYIRMAAASIVERPFWGVGPGNFIYISQQFSESPEYITYTAHNIFLDILTEYGILATIIFLVILFSIITKSHKGLIFILMIFMLINFQTHYTYKIYSFFLLFITLMALEYKGENNTRPTRLLLYSTILFIAATAMIVSSLFMFKKNYTISHMIYPLRGSTYPALIETKQNPSFYIGLYKFLYSGDSRVFRYVGQYYEKRGEKDKAIENYVKAYHLNPLGDIWVTAKLYEYDGVKYRKDIEEFFKKIEKVENKGGIENAFLLETMRLCQKIYNLHCPYSLMEKY